MEGVKMKTDKTSSDFNKLGFNVNYGPYSPIQKKFVAELATSGLIDCIIKDGFFYTTNRHEINMRLLDGTLFRALKNKRKLEKRKELKAKRTPFKARIKFCLIKLSYYILKKSKNL